MPGATFGHAMGAEAAIDVFAEKYPARYGRAIEWDRYALLAPHSWSCRALGLIAHQSHRARPSSSMISLRLLTRCPGPSDQRSFFFYGGNFEFSNQTRKPRILDSEGPIIEM